LPLNLQTALATESYCGQMDVPVEVQIDGLPVILLAEAVFDVVMQQAALEDDELRAWRQVLRDAPYGCLRVVLRNNQAAARCFQHFHGCQWSQAMPVTATYLGPSERLAPARGGIEEVDESAYKGSESADQSAYHLPAGLMEPNINTYGASAASPQGYAGWRSRNKIAATPSTCVSEGLSEEEVPTMPAY
jgi:hypothetical protein